MTLHHRREPDAAKVRRLARTAIEEGWGTLIKPGHVHLDEPVNCVQPYRWTLYSRGGRDFVTGERYRPITVTGAGRCRKCPFCDKAKSNMWSARAVDEFYKAPRTLFGDFTTSPANDDLLDNRARVRLREKDVDFDKLDAQSMLTERVREFGAEVTKWLDVVRHGRDGHTPTPIRYLLVAEVHDSDRTSEVKRGRPHFHILIHEKTAGSAVKGDPRHAIIHGGSKTWCDIEAGEWEQRMIFHKSEGVWRPHAFVRDEAFIRKNWTLGHCKFQWAEDARGAYYVCKYISKSLLRVRPRASKKYGKLPSLPGVPLPEGVGQSSIEDVVL